MQENNNEPVSVKAHLSNTTKQFLKILGVATIIYVAILLNQKKIKKIIIKK